MTKLPALWLSLSFIIGIYLTGIFTLPVVVIPVIGLVAFLFFIAKYFFAEKTKVFVFISFIFLAFSLGSLRLHIKANNLENRISSELCDGQQVFVQGRIINSIMPSQGYAVVDVEISSFINQDFAWQEVSLIARMRLPEGADLRYDEKVTLKSTFQPAIKKDEKSFRSYLIQNNIDCLSYYPQFLSRIDPESFSPKGTLFKIKSHSHQVLQQIIPFPESELLAGILLGIESRIPQYLKDAFTQTGTSHIVAISGFNIVLLANTIKKVFDRFFNYRFSAVLSIIVIGLYSLMIGPQPAVVRAAIMGIVAIPASLIGRKVIGFYSIALTAAIMALFNPFVIWSLSFQLSFCATFGILMFNNYFNHYLKIALEKSNLPSKKFVFSFLQETLITTLSAQIATFPVLISNFGDFYPLSILVNFIILPLQSWIMISGGLALLAGILYLPAGRIIGVSAWLVAGFNNQVVKLFALFSSGIRINSDFIFWISIVSICCLSYFALQKQKAQYEYFDSIEQNGVHNK